jgi:hypothetical protein
MKHFKWRSRRSKNRFGHTDLVGYFKIDVWFFYVLIPKLRRSE